MRWMLVSLVACQAASPVAKPVPPAPRVSMTITGRIVAPDRTPVAGAVVALVSAAGLEHHTSTDAAGAFRFRAVHANTAWGISAHASSFTGAFIDAIEPARPVELALAPIGADAVTIRLPVKVAEALPPDA